MIGSIVVSRSPSQQQQSEFFYYFFNSGDAIWFFVFLLVVLIVVMALTKMKGNEMHNKCVFCNEGTQYRKYGYPICLTCQAIHSDGHLNDEIRIRISNEQDVIYDDYRMRMK